ncbi:hypothetical protein VSDG_00133 [Cytospora chrysosperma]|uniref:Polycomb protein EED n=1 Tax=Cytospora chrysosperma TaxID=252740 RepID=A0A423WPE8_CYTCH|nr:hypothetical protein VSDG_00133 [Valsa sordida]
MAPAPPEPSEWDLPRLRASFGFEDDFKHLTASGDADTEFFDVKFYPYDPVGADPIFAAVSKKHVVVCRLSQVEGNSNPCELIRIIRDDDEAVNCSCCWSKEAGTERVLLCVAGADAKIKVYNIKEGKLFTTLVGHGGAFHSTGRYILSAGHDQVINLWTVPDLPKQHVDSPIVVHYPHFSTSEVHFGLIDCVAFYGDLILSRACHEDKIVLWRIEGFSSDDPPPLPSTAPTAYDQARTTRSAFAPVNSPSCPSLWVRLLQFETRDCGPQFFLRFSMHHVYGQHPILCFCNAKNEIMMWDMARLTGYQDYINKIRDPDRDPDTKIKRPGWLVPVHHRAKKVETNFDPVYSAAVAMRPVGYHDPFDIEKYLLQEQSPETVENWQSKYDTSNPFKLIKPHRSDILGGPRFVGRQVAWSPEGEWCVIVGSQNMAVIMQRWAKGGRHSMSRQNSHVPSEAQSRQGTAAASGGNEAAGANSFSVQPDAVM